MGNPGENSVAEVMHHAFGEHGCGSETDPGGDPEKRGSGRPAGRLRGRDARHDHRERDGPGDHGSVSRYELVATSGRHLVEKEREPAGEHDRTDPVGRSEPPMRHRPPRRSEITMASARIGSTKTTAARASAAAWLM